MIATCNRTTCQKKFEVPNDTPRDKFEGLPAARLLKMITCPHCQRVDSHWVIARDVMPVFTGTTTEIDRQLYEWCDEN